MSHSSLFKQDVRFLVQSQLYNKNHYALCYKEALVAFSNLRKRARMGHLSDLEAPFIQKNPPEKSLSHAKHILIMGNKKDVGFLQPMIDCTQSWIPIQRAWPRTLFLDTIDPRIFWEALSICNPKETLIFFISSSGDSPESVMPLMRCVEYWKNDLKSLRNIATIIAPTKKGVLHTISEKCNLCHKEYIPSFLECRQYFSDTMLSIAEMSGFHAEKFKKGAALTCTAFFRGSLSIPIEYTALCLLARKEKDIMHYTCYSSLFDFERLTQWMHHNVSDPEPWIFQKSKPHDNGQRTFYTLFMERNMTKEPLTPSIWQDNMLLLELSKNPLFCFVHKNHDGLCRKIIKEGHFLRTLHVEKADEIALGALFMNHILENLMMKEAFDVRS